MNSKNTLGHFHLRLEPKCAMRGKEKTKLSQNTKSYKIFIHVHIYRCIHTHTFSVYISTHILLTDIWAIYLHIYSFKCYCTSILLCWSPVSTFHINSSTSELSGMTPLRFKCWAPCSPGNVSASLLPPAQPASESADGAGTPDTCVSHKRTVLAQALPSWTGAFLLS